MLISTQTIIFRSKFCELLFVGRSPTYIDRDDDPLSGLSFQGFASLFFARLAQISMYPRIQRSWHKSKRFLHYHGILQPPRLPLLGVERRPIRTVIDVGAFDGDTGRIFRHMFPQATIHCFEPQPDQYRRLANWAAKAGDQVHAYPYGLGEHATSMELQTIPSMPRFASFLPGTDELAAIHAGGNPIATVPVTVQVKRLDDLAVDLCLKDEILVKIDTEGFERQVILGGTIVLKRALACIIEVNVSEYHQGQSSFRGLIDLMEQHELLYAGNVSQGIIPATGLVGHFDALFLRRI